MNIALISIILFTLTIFIGIIKPKINLGIIAITFAFLVGILLMGLKEKQISELFPTNLFLMLVSITTFFGIAMQNNTLNNLSRLLVKFCRGNNKIIPISFFLITFLLSSIGPGNIAATAIIAPIALVITNKLKLNPLLMIIMVCTGANAGAFSPISPTGIISIGLISKIGISNIDIAIKIYLTAAVIQSISALAAYLLFKGYSAKNTNVNDIDQKINFSLKQGITILFIFLLVIAIAIFKFPIVLTATTLSFILFILNFAEGEKVIKKLPWDSILLVCGVTVLIGILEKAGGLELATTVIAKFGSVGYINGLLALITGLISAYSSSSGVVMPAFIPLVPGLIEKLGGGDIIKMIIAINVGSHMVDVSPLSTLGAISLASYIGTNKEKNILFRKLMIWGLSMAIVGAGLSYVFLDLM